jgi:hypothetical protein
MCDSKHFHKKKKEKDFDSHRYVLYRDMENFPLEKEKCAISSSFAFTLRTLFSRFLFPFLNVPLRGTKLQKKIRQVSCSTYNFNTLYHFFLHFVPFNLNVSYVC